MFYTYAFYDKTRKIFYIGYTNDLKRRVAEHNCGKTQTTSRMDDKMLVYYEACISQEDAMEREKQLKTGFGKGYLKRRLKNHLADA